MVLANRLTDGRVVFLAADESWVDDIAAGALAASAAAAERLLAEARRAEEINLVIDPYLIDIETADGVRRPLSFRERIRASGPTLQPALAG
jgi:hypothetical protein